VLLGCSSRHPPRSTRQAVARRVRVDGEKKKVVFVVDFIEKVLFLFKFKCEMRREK
jgi:hypothetical protein